MTQSTAPNATDAVDPTAHDSGNKATDKFKSERVTADTSKERAAAILRGRS